MSKNAKQLFKENKFGIRKFTVGVASVIIGTSFYLGAENQAQAAESNQTEMSSSQESSGANGGNNENVEADSTTTEQTNVAEQSIDQSNVETTTNDTESTTETPVNESVNTKEDTSSVESNETSKTDETNTNTKESTRGTNVESTTDTNTSNKQIEEKTDDTTVTTSKEEQSQNETTVDNNEKEVNTSETNTVESKTEQNQPSSNNTEDRTTAGDNSKQDQSVNNNVEKETPKEESTTNNVENHTSVDDKSESKQSVNNSIEKETSKEETTENKEEKSNDTANNNLTNETEKKVDSTNNNKEENAPKEDKSTSQSETTESNTKEEPKSEEVKNSSDESNKEDNKTVNDNVDTSNKVNSEYKNTDLANITQDEVNDNTNGSNVLTSEESKDLAKIQNASVLNAPLLPVSDDPEDSYTLNAGLNEPVVTTRETGKEAAAITATTVTKNAEYFEDPSLLTNDKYEILELTSENVTGKDKYTKDTFNTHMVVKLDDSVKVGDKLVYGVGYDYTDLNGDIHKVYLPSSNDYSSHTTPIIYQNVQIGTMTVTPPTYEINDLPPRDFSVDEADGTDDKYYAMKGSPVTITFNDNIDKFKNVELTLDNVFVKNKSFVAINGSTVNGFYIDKGYSTDNITKNADGTIDVEVPNEFQINDQVKDLNLKIEAVENTDSLKSSSVFNDNQAWNYTTEDRQYIDTPNGTFVQDDNLLVYRSAAPSKTPTNELHYHIVVPKALQDKAEFAFAGIDNNSTINFDDSYLSPHQNTVSAQSKFNPTTFDSNIYTGLANNIKTSSPNIDWDITRNLTTNDNGDLVYDVTFKTKDGSYVTLVNDPVYLYAYRLKEELPHSNIEEFDVANMHPTLQKWGIPEWDQLLKENPITMKVDSSTESGMKTANEIVNSEGYRISKITAQTAPEGSVRVAAKDETVTENIKTEDIDYKVIRIPDSTLDEGVEITDTEGVKGSRTYTERVFTKTATGEITDVQRIDETVTKEPVDKVVRYGINTNVDDVTYNKRITKNKNTAPQENKKIDSLNMSLTPDSDEHVIIDGHDGIKYTGADGEIILSNDDTNIFDNINTLSKQTIFDKEKENFKSDLDSKISYTNLDISDFKEVENSDGTKSYVATYHYDYQLAPFENVVDTYVEHSPHAYDSTISHNETSYKTIREIDWDLKPGSDDVVITQGENGYNDVIGHYLSGYDSTLTSDFGWEPYFDGNRESLSDEERENFENSLNNSYGIDVLKDQYPNFELESFKDGVLKVKIGESESSKDAIDEVIHYAPVEIPYKTDEIETNELKKGETKVQSEGRVGLKDPETNEVYVEAENRVILVGTGVKGTNTKERIEEVDFETDYVENNQLPKGEERIKIQGKVGFDKITTTENTIDGEIVDSSDDRTRLKDPVTQIIERGTGIVDVKIEKNTVKVPFEEREVFDKNLKEGERVISTKGKDGIDTVITTTPTLNGKVNGDSKIEVEHTTEPVTQIVRVGIGIEGENKVIENVPVPFETDYIDDKSIPKGKEIVDVNGEYGIDRITTITPTFNGEELLDKVKTSKEHIKEPVNRVIRRGTGIEDIRTETKTEPLKFGTDKEFDDNLPEGYKEIVREGENGEITITIKTPILNGKDNGISDESRVISKQPVNEIIKIGTGKLTTKTTTSKTSNSFKVIYKETDELEKGQTRVEKHGQNGIVETITKQDYVNGKKYGDPDVTTNELQSVIDEVVLIGTKEPSNPVKPLDPDNNNYDPNGNDITKDKGHKITPKEITDQVEIPKYPSDKGTPVKTVEDETLIPDSNTTGDYTVPVIVTYPDGSKDYVGVIVHIIDTDDDESIVEKVIDKDTGEIVKTDNSNNETISTPNTKYVVDNNSSELIDNKGHIGIQMNKQQDGHTKYIIDEKPVQKDATTKENNVINQTNVENDEQLPDTGDNQQSKTVTFGLITMALGAALTFARRRKQKEDK